LGLAACFYTTPSLQVDSIHKYWSGSQQAVLRKLLGIQVKLVVNTDEALHASQECIAPLANEKELLNPFLQALIIQVSDKHS
jgi:hypothetical protein